MKPNEIKVKVKIKFKSSIIYIISTMVTPVPITSSQNNIYHWDFTEKKKTEIPEKLE